MNIVLWINAATAPLVIDKPLKKSRNGLGSLYKKPLMLSNRVTGGKLGISLNTTPSMDTMISDTTTKVITLRRALDLSPGKRSE